MAARRPGERATVSVTGTVANDVASAALTAETGTPGPSRPATVPRSRPVDHGAGAATQATVGQRPAVGDAPSPICAVERCRLQPLAGPTSLEIGDEQVEVWLCAFHATSLAADLSWLRRMAREAMAHEL